MLVEGEQVEREVNASTQRASANQGEANMEREKAPEVQRVRRRKWQGRRASVHVCAHAELLRQLFSFVTSVLPGVLSKASDTWAAVEGKLGMCTRLSCRGERRASAEGQPHVCVCMRTCLAKFSRL